MKHKERVRRLKRYLAGDYNILDWRKTKEVPPGIPYV